MSDCLGTLIPTAGPHFRGTLPFSHAERQIHNGDLLLFARGGGFFSWLISVAGRSNFSHAGMAVWLNENACRTWRKLFPRLKPGLYCAHTQAGRGGQLDPLGDLVKKSPGRIVVRKPIAELQSTYNRRRAKAEMLKIVGKPYGWAAIRRTALTHLPIVRLALWRYIAPFLVDDGGNGGLPFCSMADSRAARLAGNDPVPNLGDRWTEPGDLSRSAGFYDWAVLAPDPLTPDP
jgi:hypothetical protein